MNTFARIESLNVQTVCTFRDGLSFLFSFSFFLITDMYIAIIIIITLFKAGGNMKALFWLGIMFLMQISCLRFKQSRISLLISHIYVLGCFVNFLVIFRYIWREIVFLKGLVKSDGNRKF